MITSIYRGTLMVGLATLLLAGCSSKQEEPMTEDPSTVAPPVVVPMVEKAKPEPVVPASPMVKNHKLFVPGGMSGMEELQGIFYFDFDQAIVKRSGHAELNKHAMAMKDDRSLKARLEGHADERGTREYNLALGERRANAVKAYLQAQGAMASQIEVISYGEEKPAMAGHSEQAWSQNRRVEIVYK